MKSDDVITLHHFFCCCRKRVGLTSFVCIIAPSTDPQIRLHRTRHPSGHNNGMPSCFTHSFPAETGRLSTQESLAGW